MSSELSRDVDLNPSNATFPHRYTTVFKYITFGHEKLVSNCKLKHCVWCMPRGVTFKP